MTDKPKKNFVPATAPFDMGFTCELCHTWFDAGTTTPYVSTSKEFKLICENCFKKTAFTAVVSKIEII
jgi:hypothetical protein